MAPPSQLAIATSTVNRLVKEERSYHDELKDQGARLEKLLRSDTDDENAEYEIRQQRKAIEETNAMFPIIKTNIQNALARLEQQLEQDKGPGDQSTPEDITKAKEAVASALTAIRESS